MRYAGIDKEYSFPLEDDEDEQEEEGDDLNTCIRLAHWKLNWSISNDAIYQILGKDYNNYKIKSHSVLSLLSRIKEWMKMKIPFKEWLGFSWKPLPEVVYLIRKMALARLFWRDSD